jgi:hypothetical protein
MRLSAANQRKVVIFIGSWLVLIAGFYAWSVRDLLGFRSLSYFSDDVHTSLGTVSILCSIQTPIRPNRTSGLSCLVKAPLLVNPEVAPPLTHPLQIGVSVSGDGFLVSPPDQHVVLQQGGGQQLLFEIEPRLSGDRDLLVVITVDDSAHVTKWTVGIEFKPREIIFFPAIFAVFLMFLYVPFSDLLRIRILSLEEAKASIERAEQKVEREPTKVKPAWDLARVKLEAYFDRNLFQVNQVFWLATAMMVVGFAFVLAAVVMSLNHPDVTPASKVAALSGIIAQFIGATFLVIYRSTMAQANEFMSVLERINTVGMAVQVLDSIPDSNALKDKTRAEIVELLLSANVPSKSRVRTKGESKPSV